VVVVAAVVANADTFLNKQYTLHGRNPRKSWAAMARSKKKIHADGGMDFLLTLCGVTRSHLD